MTGEAGNEECGIGGGGNERFLVFGLANVSAGCGMLAAGDRRWREEALAVHVKIGNGFASQRAMV